MLSDEATITEPPTFRKEAIMLRPGRKWLQFSVRALLVVTLVAATFCAGYRLGFDDGRNARSEALVEEIINAVKPTDWSSVGGVGQIADPYQDISEPVFGDNPFGLPQSEPEDSDSTAESGAKGVADGMQSPVPPDPPNRRVRSLRP